MQTVSRPRAGAGRPFALFILLVMSQPVAYSASLTELRSARASLSAARDALSAASAEFRSMQSEGGLSRSGTTDYLEYLGRLRRSVLSNCRTVLELKLELGEAGPEPGCDAEEMKPAGPVSFPGERTEEERIAVIDGELGKSMSEFDELLLREMDELRRKRSGSPDGSGRSGSEGEGEGEASGEDGERAEMSGESTQEGDQDAEGRPQEAQDAAQSDPNQQQSGAHGGSRPGGQDPSQTVSRDAPPADDDDDIVARQLREAAEKETDPQLREKLWEEYRRYKEKQTAQSKNLN